MSLDNLPVEWLLTSIENISEVIAGGTPKANDPENFVEPPNGIGWLTPADLSGYSHKYIGHGKRDLSEKGYKSSSAKLIPKGSVVFSSRAPIGYVAIASNEISTNQGFKNFVIDENISSEYLYYYLKRIRDLAESLGTGTTFKELSGSACKKLPFVLAPLVEQQEIVRQLDIMLAQVEQIKARLDAIPAILKKFRQSVLADAVSGKLTEEWRKSNPHTISIETIESCRLNKWWLEKQKDLLSKGKKVTEKDKAKYKPAYLPESNFYGAIPPEWSLCTIDHLFDVTKLAGFEFTKFVKYHDDYDIPVIKAENVGKNGFKETQFSKVEKTVVDALPRSSIFGNELLIVFVGAGTGQVGRVPSNRRYFLGPNVALVKPNLCDLINSEFFEYLLRSLSGQDSLLSFAKGAAQPSLSMDQIRHATIVVPPIEEQEVILASIKILFNKASQIESLVNIAQKRVNLLTQSILAKAFSGELTAEWREQHQDLVTGVNSAEALLAKIQAEREASKPVKKTWAKKEA